MIDIKVLASGSSGNCYLIGDGKSRLLLDAGIKIELISAACDYRLSELAGCLITHCHKDHSRVAEDLERRGVKTFGTVDMVNKGFKIKAACHMNSFSLGTWDIVPFRVEHDCPCYGYKLTSVATGDQLVYITDAAGIPYKFKDINYWLVEANYSLPILDEQVRHGMDIHRANRVIDTHMAIEDLEAYFEDIDTSMANAIYLCHLSNDNSDAEDFRERIRRVTGAPVYVA